MKIKRIIIMLVSVFVFSSYSYAQSDEEEFSDVPLPPDLPDPMESGEIVEPQITIIRTETEVIEEYRLNGHLYKVKITPLVGKPYYLIDADGDGQMEGRISDIYNTDRVPQWVLFNW